MACADGMRPPANPGNVVIARQHHNRHAPLGQTTNALGKLPLVRLARVARLIRISGEDGELHAALQRDIDGCVESPAEVQQTRIEAG